MDPTPRRPGPHQSHRDDAPRLSADLRAMYSPERPIPDEVRDELKHQAHSGLDDLKRSRRWGGLGIVAAAAMIVFAFQLVLHQMATRPRRESPAPASVMTAAVAPREDIDGNGRVNILDAFVLAKRVSASTNINPAWDINADGNVNAQDVDAVAQAAVQLKGGA